MTEATHEDTTVITSNVRTSKPNQEQYMCSPMNFKPRRMISFKHEPLKNENIIEDDIEMSDIENQEELEAEQDEFKPFLFSKRASRPANAVIRCLYAPNLTPGPEENILIMDSAAGQSVVGQGFKIMFYTGQQIKMDGAL